MTAPLSRACDIAGENETGRHPALTLFTYEDLHKEIRTAGERLTSPAIRQSWDRLGDVVSQLASGEEAGRGQMVVAAPASCWEQGVRQA